jgi:hypothetical protein
VPLLLPLLPAPADVLPPLWLLLPQLLAKAVGVNALLQRGRPVLTQLRTAGLVFKSARNCSGSQGTLDLRCSCLLLGFDLGVAATGLEWACERLDCCKLRMLLRSSSTRSSRHPASAAVYSKQETAGLCHCCAIKAIATQICVREKTQAVSESGAMRTHGSVRGRLVLRACGTKPPVRQRHPSSRLKPMHG